MMYNKIVSNLDQPIKHHNQLYHVKSKAIDKWQGREVHLAVSSTKTLNFVQRCCCYIFGMCLALFFQKTASTIWLNKGKQGKDTVAVVIDIEASPSSLPSRINTAIKKRQAADEYEEGCKYLKGGTKDKDFILAKVFFEKAARKGHSDAAIQLGRIYFEGLGIPKNNVKARNFFEKGMNEFAQHRVYAAHQLGRIYKEGLGVSIDLNRALEYFEKSLLWGRDKTQRSDLLKDIELSNFQQILFITNALWYHPTTSIGGKEKIIHRLRSLFAKEGKKLDRLAFIPKSFTKKYSDLIAQLQKYEVLWTQAQEDFSNKIVQLFAKPPAPIRIRKKYKIHVLNQAIGVGLKGTSHPQITELAKKYRGLWSLEHSLLRYDQAMLLLDKVQKKENRNLGLKTLEEQNGLLRICQQRKNILEYARKICHVQNISSSPFDLEALIKEIQENIDLLDDPKSSKVISLNDGSTTFSIIGGWTEHAISYEFKKKGDDYFFIIHNRGAGTSSNIHGFVRFENDEGKEYSKTSVPIKVSKDDLKNPVFIQRLIESQYEKAGPYRFIYQFLIDSGRGTLVKSEIELLLEKLYEQYHSPFIIPNMQEEIRQAALLLIQKDHNFHSNQLYGTCVESNLTALEKQMAPDSVIRTLKMSTLTHLVHRISAEYMGLEHRENAKLTTTHANIKIEKLKRKLETSSSVDSPIDFAKIQALIKKVDQQIITNEKISDYPINLDNIGNIFAVIPEKLKGNKKIVLEAVEQNGLALEFASSAMKKNREVVIKAVEENAFALEFADEIRRNDKTIAIKAVRQNGLAFEFVSDRLKKDRDVISAAIKQNYRAFELLPTDMKVNRLLILEMVKEEGIILKIIPEELMKDREFIFNILIQIPHVLFYVIPELKGNKDFILSLVANKGEILKYIDPKLKQDKDFIIAAVTRNGAALEFADRDWQKNKEIVLAAVRNNGLALKFAIKTRKRDMVIAETAVRQNGVALEFVGEALKRDLSIVSHAVRQNGLALQFANIKLQKNKDIALEAVNRDANAFEFVSKDLKQDKDVVLAADRKNGLIV